MRRAQARQSYIFRYVVILLRVYWRKVTRARRTASADWRITPGTAGMRPRDLFDFAQLPRIGRPKELRSYLVSHDTTRFLSTINKCFVAFRSDTTPPAPEAGEAAVARRRAGVEQLAEFVAIPS
ncbi:hypothetical protein EVAR_32168_1 [Eumeta japonica]|uniref:Uncharacterized protein n=1 Tax=Eumeta variegata TaxID=151549 RepID=A0A4C1VZ59_EUMVA|nr:hypothetical protein EVAR_32168_1 [Eumeta japonica]